MLINTAYLLLKTLQFKKFCSYKKYSLINYLVNVCFICILLSKTFYISFNTFQQSYYKFFIHYINKYEKSLNVKSKT